MAGRECQASLKWGKQTLVVAEKAAEIDLDLFDVELGTLGPVAAFQVRNSATECCMTYQIYSLNAPVRLLRTVKGGYFTGADTDLDGRVEVWAEDTAAIDGLDGLATSAVEYPPMYALRFEKGRLLNASAEFQSYFNDIIAKTEKKENSDDLRAFKQSDGRLGPSSENPNQLARLRAAKIQVLEIVWAHLSSGHEKKAWEILRAMWPDADFDRMQAALTKAHDSGVLSQVDGESAAQIAAKHAQVFDDLQPNSVTAMQIDEHLDAKPVKVFGEDEARQPPQPIDIWRPERSVPEETPFSTDDEMLDLLIDSAGKVRSVQWADKKKPKDTELMNSALEWKFIPGLQHGHSVACHLRFGVHPKR